MRYDLSQRFIHKRVVVESSFFFLIGACLGEFPKNILKIGVFCNKVIFQAIFNVFFEEI